MHKEWSLMGNLKTSQQMKNLRLNIKIKSERVIVNVIVLSRVGFSITLVRPSVPQNPCSGVEDGCLS